MKNAYFIMLVVCLLLVFSFSVTASSSIIDELVANLSHPEGTVRRDAIMQVRELGLEAQTVVPKLMELLHDEADYVRFVLANTLGQMGKAGIPGLLICTKDISGQVRQAAINALGMVGENDHEVTSALKLALEDQVAGVRLAAIKSVGKLKVFDADILIRLGILMGDGDMQVAFNARNVLSDAELLNDAIPLLVDSLLKGTWQREILNAFKRLGAFGAEFVSTIALYLDEPDEELWPAVLDALAIFSVHSIEALPQITEKLLHPNQQVQRAALSAIEKIGTFDKDIIQKLTELLDSGDPILAWEATRLLFMHGFSYREFLTDEVLIKMQNAMDGLNLQFIRGQLKDFQLPAWPQITPNKTIVLEPGDDIQAALDKLAEQGGGTVYLLEGIYEIGNTILLRSNIELRGVGPTTVIKRNADAQIDKMIYGEGGLSDVVIKDLTIDGNKQRQERNWIWQVDSDTAWPYGLIIVDDNGKANYRVVISGVRVTRTAMGLHSKGTHDLVITDVMIFDNGGVNLYFHNCYLRRNQRVMIKNSTFADSHTANGLNLTAQENIVVQNNVFINNAFRGVRAANTRNIIIANNVASFNKDFGIGTRSEDGGVTRYLIYNNYASFNGINYSLTSVSDGVSIDNISFR